MTILRQLIAGVVGLVVSLIALNYASISAQGVSDTAVAVRLRRLLPQVMTFGLPSSSEPDHRRYEAQIFSRDPLVIYLRDFLSETEVKHLIRISNGKYQPSPLYRGDEVVLDETRRFSEFVEIHRDKIVKQIEKRARKFQGWRGNSTRLQPPRVHKYGVGGFLDYHYDYDTLVDVGNRVTSFMVYLENKCTGGGTNFPRLTKPKDPKWCTVIDCESEYPGVTFKPVAGSAVFWENMHPNGSFHRGVAHAALPVLSGEKIGLNLWYWDSDWRLPT